MFKVGDVVKCVDVAEFTQRYGGSSGKLSDIAVGSSYTVTDVEVHSWHTKLTLDGVPGQFNSCLFEEPESAADSSEAAKTIAQQLKAEIFRLRQQAIGPASQAYINGWNACLDKVCEKLSAV